MLTSRVAKAPAILDTPPSVSGKSTLQPEVDPLAKEPPELMIRDFEFQNPFGRSKKQAEWQSKRNLTPKRGKNGNSAESRWKVALPEFAESRDDSLPV